ncbi:MAG: hypothetical protein J7K98_03120, partial [Candidatus Aenigmarchaeota archaeon]|nr:hypothetical protein [Candidatus Aenigmarchaeota archaeon]
MVEIVWYVGIELLTIPIILGGIGYGPIFGFLLGFIIDKVFDVLRILVAPPVTTRVTPLIPTFGSLILGIIGALAGVFGYFIPFVDLVLYLTIIKNVMFVFKELFMKRTPFVAANLLNIPFNYFLAVILWKVGLLKLLGI